MGDKMSNKKSSKKKSNNFPYANELKKARDGLVNMIYEMSDIEFMLFSSALAEFIEEYTADFDENEDYLDDEDLPF